MSDKSTNPDSGTPESSEDSYRDLHDLFRQTSPKAPPLNTDALLAAAAIRRPVWGSKRYWALTGAAALVLITLGMAGGWWAGHSAVVVETAQIETTLNNIRAQIVQDLNQTIYASHKTVEEAHQDDIKRLALLLRNDYRTRLAKMKTNIETLAYNVNTIAMINTDDSAMISNTMLMEN